MATCIKIARGSATINATLFNETCSKCTEHSPYALARKKINNFSLGSAVHIQAYVRRRCINRHGKIWPTKPRVIEIIPSVRSNPAYLMLYRLCLPMSLLFPGRYFRHAKLKSRQHVPKVSLPHLRLERWRASRLQTLFFGEQDWHRNW